MAPFVAEPETRQLISTRLRALWLAVALAAVCNVIIFDVLVIASPPALQVTYVPDDAYYYLALVRNFVHLRTWTFDSGISRTSGFHPLLAYVLVSAYVLFKPGTDAFVRMSLAVSSTLTLIAVACIVWRSWKRSNCAGLACVAVVLGTRNVLLNSVSGVEWPLIVLIIVGFCVQMARNNASKSGLASIFVLGALGSLARSDFGLLPFAFFAASLLIRLETHNARFIVPSAAGLAGASLGVGILCLHNHMLTGLALQSSAVMKRQWLNAHDSLRIISVGLAGLILAGVLMLFLRNSGFPASRSRMSRVSEDEKWFGIAGVLAWAGYVILYSSMSGVQPWYSANLLMPVFVFLGGVWRALERLRWGSFALVPHAAFLFLVLGMTSVTCFRLYPISVNNSGWPHQEAMLRAGNYLRENALPARVAGWNVGVVNYYQGGSVINLDGVVNNDVYPYVVKGALPQYMQQQRIGYIVDFENMFERTAASRGGYDDQTFLAALHSLKTFDRGQYPRWRRLTLYRIDR